MVTIEQQWQTLVSRSFEPRQWYERDEDDCKGGFSEGLKVWVYRQLRTGEGWEVGYYSPDGTWFQDGVFLGREAAANRVRWLNGGAG